MKGVELKSKSITMEELKSELMQLDPDFNVQNVVSMIKAKISEKYSA